MELQRILAPDTRSATDRATALFGPDVLIISNHRVNGQTELVVAVDLDEKALLARQDLAISNETAFSSHLSRIQVQTNGAETKQAIEPSWNAGEDERDYLRSREIVDLVRDELASLRREFSLSQQTSGWQNSLTPSDELGPLFAALTEAGMPTGLRMLLLDTIKNMGSEQDALFAIRDQLRQALARPSAPVPQNGVHLIAGPSGAGKSLMTARLASHAATKLNPKQVAIISYKDQRFGAWSQTQLLSAQIGVDCFRADDPATLRLLLSELSQRSLVLIDTPGIQMSLRIAEIVGVCPACVCHAIMPADASSATLKRVAQTSGVRWQSMMISKVDETSQPWPLLEFMCHNSLKISVASDGDHITNLKCDLTTDSLVQTAIANFSHMPPEQVQVGRPFQVEESVHPKVFSPRTPRGFRGPFN
jgi:flagellar biosynthesis protein FlhF